MEHCRQNLAAYKCPKRIAFVSELPKSVVGKILRRAVAATRDWPLAGRASDR